MKTALHCLTCGMCLSSVETWDGMGCHLDKLPRVVVVAVYAGDVLSDLFGTHSRRRPTTSPSRQVPSRVVSGCCTVHSDEK